MTVEELEDGTGTGLVGALGDGTGRWHLSISANRRIGVMSLLSGPRGRLANLSAPPGGTISEFHDAPEGTGDTATAAEVFSAHISERVVHSRCVYCHVQGGRSGHTRLVFEQETNPEHEALNLAVFANFLSTVEGGASRILNKIQGVAHGGGEQVPADSDDFAPMERFLKGRRLDARLVPAAITVDTLFDPVRMAPLRKTLRRAALIFAGRVPTEEEYGSIYGVHQATARRNPLANDRAGVP